MIYLQVPPHAIIRANHLMSRRVRVGQEVLVPSIQDLDSVLRLEHDMSELIFNGCQWKAYMPESEESEATLRRGTVRLTCDGITFNSDIPDLEEDKDQILRLTVQHDILHIHFDSPGSVDNQGLPELLTPDAIDAQAAAAETAAPSEANETKDNFNLRRTQSHRYPRERKAVQTQLIDMEDILQKKSDEKETKTKEIFCSGGSSEASKLRMAIESAENGNVVIFMHDCKHYDQLLAHVDLWFPELLTVRPLFRVNAEDFGTSENMSVDMTQKSQILSPKQLLQVHKSLPPKNQSDQWNLLFSSHYDGYSLRNFYRKVQDHLEPVLLVIEDNEKNIFGAFLTCVPGMSESFLGTGKSWLFSFEAEPSTVKVFPWSGTNEFFFQGRENGIVVGASDGHFGIYVDGDFNKGSINECETFLDWPEEKRDFELKYLECWNFI